MSRGMITDEIKAKSKELLGYEISVRELRLLPYIDYAIKNNKDISNSNSEEKSIVEKWMDAGHLEGGYLSISVSKEFYNTMQELLWLAYVDIHK